MLLAESNLEFTDFHLRKAGPYRFGVELSVAFLIIVSFGRKFISALSTNEVKLISSTTAWALACFKIEGLTKSVTLCLLESVEPKGFLAVILHILQLVVVVVKLQTIKDSFLLCRGGNRRLFHHSF